METVDIRWIVVPVGLIVVALAYGRWWRRINHGLAAAARWLFRFLLDSKTCSVAETFCNEVAVLWFVFPLLDTLYDHKHLNDPFLRQSFWVSGLFFLFAIALSHIAGKDKED